MSEFQSKLETLLPAEELFFPATPGFGRYKPFLEQAIAHPAKMNTLLTKFLIKTLTEKGDLVLDPMSGSGQTGVIAALLGRNAVCVELEQKFYKWQKDAIAKLGSHKTLTHKGQMVSILGDARRLSGLLQQADAVITSPPFADGFKHNPQNKEKRLQRLIEVDKKGVEKGQKWAITSREALERRLTMQDAGYGEKKDNIGNLPIGEIDVVITSPPYSEGIGHPAGENASKEHKNRLDMQRKYTEQMTSEGNIGKLKHGEVDAVITSPPYGEAATENRKGGLLTHPENCKCNFCRKNKGNRGELQGYRRVDAVITSPPYSESMTKKRKGYTIYPELGKSREMPQDDNIANLPHGSVDAIVTSPPYGQTISEKSGGKCSLKNVGISTKTARSYTEIDAVITSPPYEGSLEDRKGGGILTREGAGPNSEATSTRNLLPCKYSSSKKNIGNLKKETYLEAMLQVYREMFTVLKPDGKAIIIIKPFIRNKAVVDLPYQTWLLMQKCGFKLTKLFKLRLTQQSFWRILYQKKHPEVDVITHEYVLVAQKPFSFSS